MKFWYEFSDEWFVDSRWTGDYLASRRDEEYGIIDEFCLAGPQPA